MAIDETGLTKGLVGKLNALRKSVGDDLAEEVFAKWLEREATSQAKEKPDPVAMKIVEALAGFENDPKFNPCLSGYHPHPLYVVCLLGLQARAGAGALRRRSG